jgi:hypothetical protein
MDEDNIRNIVDRQIVRAIVYIALAIAFGWLIARLAT